MITPYNPPKPNRTTGDKLRALANKLNDGNKLGICSLLLVAGLAVTLAVMSQDTQPEPNVVTAPTIPAERTLTDTKGRTLEGTILAKTNTSISFQRKGTNAGVDIKIDMLSQEDKAFLDTLVTPPIKKPTVLMLTSRGSTEYKYTVMFLRNNGYDVTIGVCPARNQEDKTFDEVSKFGKAILVDKVQAIDPYDILWFPYFDHRATKSGAEDTKKLGGLGTHLEPNYYDLNNRHQKSKKLSIINSLYSSANSKYYLKEGIRRPDVDKERHQYFVKSQRKTWIFYSIGNPEWIDYYLRLGQDAEAKDHQNKAAESEALLLGELKKSLAP